MSPWIKLSLLVWCAAVYIGDAVIVRDYPDAPTVPAQRDEQYHAQGHTNVKLNEEVRGAPATHKKVKPIHEVHEDEAVEHEEVYEPAMVYILNQIGENTHVVYLNGDNATTSVQRTPEYHSPRIPPAQHTPSPQPKPVPHSKHLFQPNTNEAPLRLPIFYPASQSPEEFIRLANEYFLKRNQHNFAPSPAAKKPHYVQPAKNVPKHSEHAEETDEEDDDEAGADGDEEDDYDDEDEGDDEDESRGRRGSDDDDTRSTNSDEDSANTEEDSDSASSEEERPTTPKPAKKPKPKHSPKTHKKPKHALPPSPPPSANGYQIHENQQERYVSARQPMRVPSNYQLQPERLFIRRIVPRPSYGPIPVRPLMLPRPQPPLPQAPQFVRSPPPPPPPLYLAPVNRPPQRAPFYPQRPAYYPVQRVPNYYPVMPPIQPIPPPMHAAPMRPVHQEEPNGNEHQNDNNSDGKDNDEDERASGSESNESNDNENESNSSTSENSGESNKKQIHRVYSTKHDASDGGAKKKHTTKEKNDKGGHNRHESGFEKSNGSKFNRENHKRNGFKTNEGFDMRGTYGKGKKKAYDEKHYAENNAKKRSEADASQTGSTSKVAHTAEKKSDYVVGEQSGGKFNEKLSHKKGAKTLGYHNVFHKDEYKKVHIFYDDVDHHGSFKKHGESTAAQHSS